MKQMLKELKKYLLNPDNVKKGSSFYFENEELLIKSSIPSLYSRQSRSIDHNIKVSLKKQGYEVYLFDFSIRVTEEENENKSVAGYFQISSLPTTGYFGEDFETWQNYAEDFKISEKIILGINNLIKEKEKELQKLTI